MTGLIAFAALILGAPLFLPAVQQPNFSGEWVLASATSDATRGGGPGEQAIKSPTVSGAVFNCGRQCRIAQQGSTLTVDKAELGRPGAAAAPAVTLPLDGKPHQIADSMNPGNEIQTVSAWKGDRVEILSTSYGVPFKQSVSLQDGLLVVTTTPGTAFTVTSKYRKNQ